MASGQYITVRESAQILGVSEKKITDLIESGQLHAYRIADQFLRLKRSEVLLIKTSGQVASEAIQYEYTFPERLRDFIVFNDFYIIALAIALVLAYFIFFTY